MNVRMKYKKGYKYQLVEDLTVQTEIEGQICISDFIELYQNGNICIKKGYAWDGCSGPTWDDKHNMRAGLVHDCLYQLMREGQLDISYRKIADTIFKNICIEDGMGKIRALYYYYGVRWFAKKAACRNSNPYPIQTAP